MPAPPRPNGRMLTVKQLPERLYNLIHTLPRGTRRTVLVALLSAAADYRAKEGKDWWNNVIGKNVKLVTSGHIRPGSGKTRKPRAAEVAGADD